MAHATPVPPSYRLFAGIDIAAATGAVVSLPPGGASGRPFTIAQTRPGFAAFQQRLLAQGHAPAEVLVALEATGTSWIALATALAEASFPAAVVNPARAHAFAHALARRGKTDALDAQMLVELAARLRPAPWTPPLAVYHELQQRLVQRDSLLDMQGQVRNQLHALKQHPVSRGRQRPGAAGGAPGDAHDSDEGGGARGGRGAAPGRDLGGERLGAGQPPWHWPNHGSLAAGGDSQLHRL